MSTARLSLLASLPSKQGMQRLAEQQRVIADASAVADIESEAHAVQVEGQRWYDVRPMLDPHLHPDELIELNTTSLAYAIQRGLVIRSATAPHMVRVTR